MERPRLVPQLYGYAVCLVSVITMLIASAGTIDGIFDAATPEMSRTVDHRFRTFESYKEHRIERLDRDRDRRSADTSIALPPDAELRRIYEDERRFELAHARYEGMRKIITSILVLLVAAALFAAHWRWLRRMNRAELA